MIGVYFSGTGNTKFCISKFLQHYNDCKNVEMYSIEDKKCIDKMKAFKEICVAYPIFYSALPPIVENFIKTNK